MSARPQPTETNLWAHQRAGVEFALERRGALLAMSMGHGKSLTAIELMRRRNHRLVVILAPKSVVPNWGSEFERHAAGEFQVLTLTDGSVKAKTELARAAVAAAKHLGAPCVVVTNHEAAWRAPFAEWLATCGCDCLVVDELHRAKAAGGRFSLFLSRISKRIPYRLGLSGTPMPHSPTDIYAQFRFLDSSVFGTSFTRFRARYCNPPEAPIWMADLSFRPIGDLKPGDKVIGWVRNDRESKRRRLVESTVVAVGRRIAPIVRVTLASGRVIRCTPDHLWLSAFHGGRAQQADLWTTVSPTPNGGHRAKSLSFVVEPTPPLVPELQQKAAWLAGMYDGEGSRNNIAQSESHNPETCGRIAQVLNDLRIPFRFHRASNGSKTCDSFQLLGGRQTFVNFLNWTRGVLVKDTAFRAAVYGGAYTPSPKGKGGASPERYGGLNRTADKVVSVEPDGVGEVVSLQTETGNYVAWGYASKNCLMGGYQNHQVIGYVNESELAAKFRSVAYESPAGAVELPETIDVERGFYLPPAAVKLYRALERDFYAEVDDGSITAANALTRLLRLQQLTGGHLRDDEGRTIEVHDAKAALLGDVLEDLPSSEPVVVFARFRHDLDEIRRVAEAGGRTVGELSGRMNDLADWQAGNRDVLAVQIQAGGLGVTMVRARVCLFFSLGYSLAEYLQARARVHRPGQTRGVLYVHLVAKGTVDERVYAALRWRQDVVEAILRRTV